MYKYEAITEPDYITKPVYYAVCFDTLGQARLFTLEERENAKKLLTQYSHIIEENEKQRVTSDKLIRIKQKMLTESTAELLKTQQEEEEKEKEDAMANITDENLTQEEINMKGDIAAYRKKVEYLIGESNKMLFAELSQYNVFKMRNILQSAFYLLGYKRNDICIPNTSRLDWISARKKINQEFYNLINEYSPIGPKSQTYQAYAGINYIEKMIEKIKEEDAAEHAAILPILLRWIKSAIAIRKADVQYRRNQKAIKDKEREEALEKNKQIGKQREEALQSALASAKSEFKPPENAESFESEEQYLEACKFKFDEKGFLEEWDSNNPEVEIPDAAAEFLDNDVTED